MSERGQEVLRATDRLIEDLAGKLSPERPTKTACLGLGATGAWIACVLAIVAFIAAFVGFVVFAWRDVHEFEVPVEEVARIDRARRAAREALLERLAREGALP